MNILDKRYLQKIDRQNKRHKIEHDDTYFILLPLFPLFLKSRQSSHFIVSSEHSRHRAVDASLYMLQNQKFFSCDIDPSFVFSPIPMSIPA